MVARSVSTAGGPVGRHSCQLGTFARINVVARSPVETPYGSVSQSVFRRTTGLRGAISRVPPDVRDYRDDYFTLRLDYLFY